MSFSQHVDCYCEKTITNSRVRRILKRGAERNIDQNLKLSLSNFVPIFAQYQVKSKKKKGLHSNFVSFFAQYRVISSPKPDAQLAKGRGGMPQVCSLFHAILQSWRPKGKGHGPMPPTLNTPLITNKPKKHEIVTEKYDTKKMIPYFSKVPYFSKKYLPTNRTSLIKMFTSS